MKPGESTEEVAAEERPKKIKTRSENIVSTVEWSQDQQRALEAALTKYPKGASVDRWEKIANYVEGKTKVQLLKSTHCVELLVKKKNFFLIPTSLSVINHLQEECQARYKQLVELVKKKQSH